MYTYNLKSWKTFGEIPTKPQRSRMELRVRDREGIFTFFL